MKPDNQPHQLSHSDKRHGVFTYMTIVAEAKLANYQLYKKLNNNWCTPEEFHKKYDNQNESNIKIRTAWKTYPSVIPFRIKAYREALAGKLSRFENEIRKLRERGEASSKKVGDYYPLRKQR